MSKASRASQAVLAVMPFTRSGNRNAMTALGSTRVENLSTAFSRHTLSKTMCGSARFVTWLKCSFHNDTNSVIEALGYKGLRVNSQEKGRRALNQSIST